MSGWVIVEMWTRSIPERSLQDKQEAAVHKERKNHSKEDHFVDHGLGGIEDERPEWLKGPWVVKYQSPKTINDGQGHR